MSHSFPNDNGLALLVNALKIEQDALRVDIDNIKALCKSLHPPLEELKKIGELQSVELQNKPIPTTFKVPSGSWPAEFVPTKPIQVNGALDVTKISNSITQPQSSPFTVHNDPVSFPENITNAAWQPHFISTLAPLPSGKAIKIPSLVEMTSFAPDFLRNVFGGTEWSPGMMFVPPRPGYFILPNRTYYSLDASTDPFIPSTPGSHGAKLVPFFNIVPEEAYNIEFPSECGSSSEKVAAFVLRPSPQHNGQQRYYYYGHYTQSRWSDKLDYERMMQCVPKHVLKHWAEKLSTVGRPEWLSKSMQQHFFPKPLYEGRMPGTVESANGSVDFHPSVVSTASADRDMEKREEKVMQDIKNFLEELHIWEKEYKMKTSMIGQDFIMQAFDRADADDPPALRLQWEYLECVDWNPDFYTMLCKLQIRDTAYEKD